MKNREFKFRAWWIPKNTWATKICIYLDDSEIGDVSECFHNSECKDDYVLQQYTGLLDKHGKEIYEGDILMFQSSYMDSNGGQYGNCFFHCSFKDGSFRFGVDDIATQEDASYYEVIGNIFETPDLLK